MGIMKKIVSSTTITVVTMLVLAIILLCIGGCKDGAFDYQRIHISDDNVVVSIFNRDVDVPLAAYYFAMKQGKKHNAYLVEVRHSISTKVKSWGWSLGKTHEREEYTYFYDFYFKKRGK